MLWKMRTLARPEHKIIISLIITICYITNNSEANPGRVVYSEVGDILDPVVEFVK